LLENKETAKTQGIYYRCRQRFINPN